MPKDRDTTEAALDRLRNEVAVHRSTEPEGTPDAFGDDILTVCAELEEWDRVAAEITNSNRALGAVSPTALRDYVMAELQEAEAESRELERLREDRDSWRKLYEVEMPKLAVERGEANDAVFELQQKMMNIGQERDAALTALREIGDMAREASSVQHPEITGWALTQFVKIRNRAALSQDTNDAS